MHQGNWTCSQCGSAITELPFEPRSEAGLLCRDCHQKQKSGGEKPPAATGERKLFEGDWKCADCGNAISQLPFQPKNTDNLKCIDCFKKSRGT